MFYQKFTRLPASFSMLFNNMPNHFNWKHALIFKWLIFLHIVLNGQWTLAQMARVAAKHITDWKFQRLLKARYWNVRILLWWAAEKTLAALPPPHDRILYIIVDSSTKEKRGKKGPVNQKGKTSKYSGYFFGIKFIVLMVAWNGYRIPVDFALILPKNDPDYQKENKLFRDMLDRFVQRVPAWVRTAIIIGDAAYASKENMKYINKLRKNSKKINWGYVMALPKTWNLNGGKKLKDLAKHTPKTYFQKTYIPPLTKNGKGRRTYYIFEKRTCLDHLGDVTVVLSRQRPNSSPKDIKALVTNLPELSARQVLSIYKRRWPIEILFKELKSGLGLGKQQVTNDKDRVEKSVGVAIIAYLTLIRAMHDQIKPNKAWSIFQLKNEFTWRVYNQQIEHSFNLKFKKYLKAI